MEAICASRTSSWEDDQVVKGYARFVAVALLLSLLAACGGPGQTTSTTAAPAETAIAGATTSAGSGQTGASGATDTLSGKLTLAGSSALLPLAQQAATAFQAKNPKV